MSPILENGETIMKKERIAWIDQLKGFAFFTVILGHTAINKTFRSWIYSFHMPLFLLMTGFTLNIEKYYESDFRDFFVKNVKRMILPYVWCELICILPRIIDAHLTAQPLNFKRLLFGIFCSNSRIFPMPSMPGYYIILLFFSLLLLWALIKITNKNKAMIAVILSVLAAFGIALGDEAVIWHLNVIPTAALLIFIGRILMETYDNNKEKIASLSASKYFLVCVGLLLVGAAFWFINGRISIHYNRYARQYLFFLLSSLATNSALCLIFMKLKPLKIFDYVGKNTLFYMLMHLPLLVLLETLQGDLSSRVYMPYINSLVIYLLMIPLTVLAERFAPFLLGREQTEFRPSAQIGAVATTALAVSAIYFKLAQNVVSATNEYLYILLGVFFPVLCAVMYLAALRVFPVIYLCKKELADRSLAKTLSKFPFFRRKTDTNNTVKKETKQ